MDGELSYVVAVPDTPEAALTVQVCSCCCLLHASVSLSILMLPLVRANESREVNEPHEMRKADMISGRRDSHPVFFF